MKNLILLFITVTISFLTSAQTPDKKWNIGLHGGATQYKGDLGNDFYKTNMPFYGFGGLSVSRYLGQHFDLSLLAVKGTVGYNRSNGRFKENITSLTLNARFNILSPAFAVRPYLFAGGGAVLFDKNLTISNKKVDYIAPSFGAGVNIRLNPSVMLNIQETFMYSTSDKRDGVVASENDAFLFHMVGLSFNFGKKKDADKDGVADRLDKCASTPTGVKVDKTGCPVDTDKDGVADYQDNCPDIAGTAALNGCPDKDGDGIADKDDRCPDVAGSIQLKGCADTDMDGVADIDDKCPATDAKYKVDVNGCPQDNDKDGVFNEDDLCPEIAGNAAMKGCADSDMDGVADNADLCPKIKGTIANIGCPEIAREDIVKISLIASKLFFETNSDKLKVASLTQLDDLVVIMNRYQDAKLLIEGHTDSQGNDEFNLDLSSRRAASVKNTWKIKASIHFA